jgi:hypothetical protein
MLAWSLLFDVVNNALAPNLLQFLIHYGEVFRVAGRLFLPRPIHLTDASERLAR